MDSVAASKPRLLRLEVPCDLWSARTACEQSREFLAAEGLEHEELDGWELVLAEATKNAVEHATETGKHTPFIVEIIAGNESIGARVHDRTHGFDFPEQPTLPPPESRGGRGLYLIRHLTDTAVYLRGRGENCLVLSRRRNRVLPPAAEAAVEKRLEEAEQTLNLMTEELSSAYESLAAIFGFTSEIPRSTDVQEFARRWLQEILEITHADWFVLRLVDPDREELHVAALSVASATLGPLRMNPPEAPSSEVRAAISLREIWFDSAHPLPSGDPLIGAAPARAGLVYPMIVNERLLATLVLARSHEDQPFTAGERNIIQTFADFLAIQIQNAHYLEENLRARLLSREMELAVAVQRSLLPERLPTGAGLSLSAFCRNAKEVGGDFYDVMECGDEGWLLVIADVMGKGLRAAMVATMFRTLVRSRLELAAKPGAFLTWINANLVRELGRLSMFVTAQLVHVNLATGRLRVAGAGHPPLLLTDSQGGVEELASSGPPLGLIKDRTYLDADVPLRPGARALIYTDGLIELPQVSGELLGLPPLKAWLRDSSERGGTAEDGRDLLLSYLDRHTAPGQSVDDQAFVLMVRST